MADERRVEWVSENFTWVVGYVCMALVGIAVVICFAWCYIHTQQSNPAVKHKIEFRLVD